MKRIDPEMLQKLLNEAMSVALAQDEKRLMAKKNPPKAEEKKEEPPKTEG